MRNLGTAIGAALLIGGVAALAFGLLQLDGLASCSGAGCADGSAILVLPAGIVAIVIGGVVLSAAMARGRSSRSGGAPGGFGGMTVFGLVFDALGATFLVIGFRSQDRTIGPTFTLIGVIFLLVGMITVGIDQWLAARRRRAARLRAAGMRGQATVLEVSDSNVTVNQNPMIRLRLRVSIPNNPPYEVSKRLVVSRIAVGQYLPGNVLPVLVDPANPRDVMIDDEPEQLATDRSPDAASAAWVEQLRAAAPAMTAGGQLDGDLLRAIGAALQQAADRAQAGGTFTSQTVDGGTFLTVNGQTVRLPPGAGAGAPAITPMATGAAPTAGLSATPPTGAANGRVSIETLTDTGVVMGDARLYAFDLSVQPAGERSYSVRHAALVPNAQAVRVIRGASFPARIDPALPGGLGIFWDR